MTTKVNLPKTGMGIEEGTVAKWLKAVGGKVKKGEPIVEIETAKAVQIELGQTTAAEGGFTFFEQDVCDETQWGEVIEEIERRFGRLDILINNAGVLEPLDAASPETLRFSDWKRVFSVNADGVFL